MRSLPLLLVLGLATVCHAAGTARGKVKVFGQTPQAQTLAFVEHHGVTGPWIYDPANGTAEPAHRHPQVIAVKRAVEQRLDAAFKGLSARQRRFLDHHELQATGQILWLFPRLTTSGKLRWSGKTYDVTVPLDDAPARFRIKRPR